MEEPEYVEEANTLEIIPQGSIALERSRDPEEVVNTATVSAKMLTDVVRKAGLSYNLGGNKEHLGIEAWQLLGKFDNATPRLVETRRILDNDGKFYGYEAKMEVVKNGQVVASADSMCTRDEANWNNRRGVPVPEFQLRSMAQTRAASKALRMAYGWIAVLAGYSATPVEEMVGDEYAEPATYGKTNMATKDKQVTELSDEEFIKELGQKKCPKCSKIMKLVPEGVSKKTGRAYKAFFACPDATCKTTLKA